MRRFATLSAVSASSPRFKWRFFGVLTLFFAIGGNPAAVLGQADRPALRDLDGHFPFTVPETAEQWQERAERLRLQTRIALGIHPLPKLADPVPTIHGRRELDGYTIEKVILESLPGHFVSGSLYRPAGSAAASGGKAGGQRPAVLYAHGHWDAGRFYEASAGQVRQLIASGAERFENAAINHMQAACVQLARMGVVVFQYDMIGYADSQQINFARGHRYGINDSNPPATEAGWPLFSPQAEGYGQSIMGLQTINTIQAFEMLARLSDVDAERIAITGASGGGTQSFIASAVEPRIAGSLPAVMVSTGMQGGCVCENACGLRVATGNIELAGLTAPRPLAMTTANDWTITMPEDGFPELQRLYALVGNPKSVELFTGAHFPHNYNHVTRVSMYGWMNRLFGLGLSEPILERDFELLRSDELTVWDDAHPRPPSGIDYERSLTAAWASQIDAAIGPQSTDEPEVQQQKRQLIAEGWRSISDWAAGYRGLASEANLRQTGHAEAESSLVSVRLVPWSSSGVDDSAEKSEDAGGAATSGLTIAVRDPLDADGGDQAPLVANPRPAAAYTYGYNAPPVVRRLGVLLDAIDSAIGDTESGARLEVGDDEIVLASFAACYWPDRIESVVWTTGSESDFDPFRDVESIRDPRFVPQALRYQGLPGLLSLLGDRVQRAAP